MQKFERTPFTKIPYDTEKIKLTRIFESPSIATFPTENLSCEKTQQVYGPLKFPALPEDRPYLFASMVLSVDGKIAFEDDPEGPLIAQLNAAALGEPRAGQGSYIAVTGTIDHYVCEKGLRSGLALGYDSVYPVVLLDDPACEGICAQRNVRLGQHVQVESLEPFRVDGVRKAGPVHLSCEVRRKSIRTAGPVGPCQDFRVHAALGIPGPMTHQASCGTATHVALLLHK